MTADGIVAAIAALFGLAGTAWLTRRFDLYKENFQGRRIPSMAGLFFVLAAAFAYGVEWLLWHLAFGATFAYWLAAVGFGFLGFYDDVRGDRTVGGFRGHLGALRNRTVTTGVVKMGGGAVLAIVIAFAIARPNWLAVAVAAPLIALSANTLNLFDLRPGRALAAFLFAGLALLAYLVVEQDAYVGYYLVFALGAAFLLFLVDSRGRVMLGDTGSNAFGAVLGVALALYLPLAAQTILLGMLALFNLWCETHSLSKTIEGNKVARSIDRKIGIR